MQKNDSKKGSITHSSNKGINFSFHCLHTARCFRKKKAKLVQVLVAFSFCTASGLDFDFAAKGVTGEKRDTGLFEATQRQTEIKSQQCTVRPKGIRFKREFPCNWISRIKK